MSNTRNVMPRDLRIGDEIMINERRNPPQTVKVKTVEHYACSQRGTHVNGDACYTWSIPVKVVF